MINSSALSYDNSAMKHVISNMSLLDLTLRTVDCLQGTHKKELSLKMPFYKVVNPLCKVVLFSILFHLCMGMEEPADLHVSSCYKYSTFCEQVINLIKDNDKVRNKRNVVIQNDSTNEEVKIHFFPAHEEDEEKIVEYYCFWTKTGVYVAQIKEGQLEHLARGDDIMLFEIEGNLQRLSWEAFSSWLHEIRQRHASHMEQVYIRFTVTDDCYLDRYWSFFAELHRMHPCYIVHDYFVYPYGVHTPLPIHPDMNKELVYSLIREIERFSRVCNTTSRLRNDIKKEYQDFMDKIKLYSQIYPDEFIQVTSMVGDKLHEIRCRCCQL